MLAFFQTTFADVDVLVSAPGPEGAELWGMRAVLGDVVLNDWQCSAQMRVRGVARGLINIIHVRSGRLCITEHGEANQVAPGHTVLLPAGQVLELECDAVETLTVGLPTALVDEVARFRTETGRVRFAGTSPISIGLERHWLGTLAYVRQVVLADIALATNPLVIGQARHMLAAAVLADFPTSVVLPQQRGPAAVTPSVVRRAMEYVEDYIERYMSLAELAGAAGVSPRALQYAFRRHQGTTPARFARRARLDRAHQDLLAGDPAAGDTVMAIATRWGFVNAKRFATDYRRAYGQPPSRTLRS
ncbi:AraC family transcriptional regulator [Micromonospora wenchangensis]|uniref:AraC family transcriptional regulator n=1 Tax=Micromonospora wenchangensis TaxID=1185415 RepID=UPI003D7363FB